MREEIETFKKYLDEKKIMSRIKSLEVLASKGNEKENIGGANETLKKIYTAVKDTRPVNLNKVSLDMFPQDTGFLRAGKRWIIGKNKDAFFLYKASEVKKLPKEDKKKLTKSLQATFATVMEIAKKNDTPKEELKNIEEQIPFAEWKNLSKTDIAEKLYIASKEDEDISEAIKHYIGKEKLTKSDVAGLSYGDIEYMFTHNSKLTKKPFRELVDNYMFTGSDTEIRLSRKADKKSLDTEEMRLYGRILDKLETDIYICFDKLKQSETLSGAERTTTVMDATVKLLQIRDELKQMGNELENTSIKVSEDQIANIAMKTGVEDEINFIKKDMIDPVGEDIPIEYKKIGLKRENEIVNYFENEGSEIAKNLGIVLEDDIKIINYGVFERETPQKALDDLLLYAKSLQEMTEQMNEIERNILQTQTSDFAI